MEKVGKIHFYASGWTAYSAVDIYYDGQRYMIDLGLFGEDSKYGKSVEELASYLRRYYAKDEKFEIKKIDLDLSPYHDKIAAQEAEKFQKQEQKQREREELDRKKQQDKVEDNQKYQDELNDIREERAAHKEKIKNLQGSLFMKIVKFYLLSVVSLVKNLFMALLNSLYGAVSTSSRFNKLVNRYYFAAIKDSLIVLTPIVAILYIIEFIQQTFS
ncbi:hypothetical protein [Sulfurimonas microaerophilic]|uniref:hypothetical protein n=1 Tax=Sulfurimonas microaerophilic TaxID=3058392 RepID=UPI0027150D99|nr:hypothetical protein [Sulfurimonas sp. hsl 1-7]